MKEAKESEERSDDGKEGRASTHLIDSNEDDDDSGGEGIAAAAGTGVPPFEFSLEADLGLWRTWSRSPLGFERGEAEKGEVVVGGRMGAWRRLGIEEGDEEFEVEVEREAMGE